MRPPEIISAGYPRTLPRGIGPRYPLAMEKRNGVWTSQARSDDARDIARLAREIIGTADDLRAIELAKKIERKARDLERDL